MPLIVPVVSERHAEIVRTLPAPKLMIGSEARPFGSGGAAIHVNAATGAEQGEVPLGGATDVKDAVSAARKALPVWRDMRPYDRRRILDRFNDLVEANLKRFCDIAVVENGVPRANFEAGHMGRVTSWMRYFSGWTDKIEGSVVSVNPGAHFEYAIAEPYGVIAHIVTWNAPLLSLSMKVPASIAAGNTVVIKPSELTPFTTQLFAELALEAGMPPGVINVVPGAVEAGEALVRHPGVDKISFTGGPNGARAIMRAAAETLKPMIFELGGKSANIVFPDVDVEETAVYSARSAMSNNGQGCSLPTRLIAHEDIYEKVLDHVAKFLQELPVGDPSNPATRNGPLINEAACSRVMGFVEEARHLNSGRVLVGGERLNGSLSRGCFVAPTLLADVDPQSRIAQTEIFGPVLVAMKFRTEEEAVEIANGTAYGLAAYVQTHDLDRAHRLIHKLKSGTVYVNRAIPGGTPAAPFGGVGLSGFGREGGKAGLDEFLRLKGVGISVLS